MCDPGPNGRGTNIRVHDLGDWTVDSGSDTETLEAASEKKSPGENQNATMLPWFATSEMGHACKSSLLPNGAGISIQGVGDWAVDSSSDSETIESSSEGEKPGKYHNDSILPWVINNQMSQINTDNAPPPDAVPSLTQQETASTHSGNIGLGVWMSSEGHQSFLGLSSESTVSQSSGDLQTPTHMLGTQSLVPASTTTGGNKTPDSPTSSVDSYKCDIAESTGLSQASSPNTEVTTVSPSETQSPSGWSTDEYMSTASPESEEYEPGPSNVPTPELPEGLFAVLQSPVMKSSPRPSSPNESSEAETSTKGTRSQQKEGNNEKVSSSGRKKRPLDDKGGPHDKDNHHAPGTRTKKAKIDDQQAPLLACPFYKKDPIRHRGCFGYVIKRIAYVRQHLFRNHLQPSHCVVCMSIFDSEEELSEHLRARACERRPQSEQPDGITQKQQKELRTMRADHRKSEKEQWYDIFTMLFPGVDLPSSPYINQGLSEDMSSFREFMERKGGAIVEETLKTKLPSIGTDSSGFREEAQAAVLRIFTEWVEQLGDKSQIGLGESASRGKDTGSSDFSYRTPKLPVESDNLEELENVKDIERVEAGNEKSGNPNSDVIRDIINSETKKGTKEIAGKGKNIENAEVVKIQGEENETSTAG